MDWNRELALLSNAQMYQADSLTLERGISGARLMDGAGRGVADEIMARYSPGKTLILCGGGNNGGDGYVIAKYLREAGWPVDVAQYGKTSDLPGDAALACGQWVKDGKTTIADLGPDLISGAEIIVDSLLGAGLARPVEGVIAETIEAANASDAVVVAVDIPSGISGDSGQILGTAIEANLTVTFFRGKRGHALAPGRFHCGEIVVIDIGIPPGTLGEIDIATYANHPWLWRGLMPVLKPTHHKYDRGLAYVVGGGPGKSGAARLAARAALRTGAGLVGTLCPNDALEEYASQQTAVMNAGFDDLADFEEMIAHEKLRAIAIGPGNGVDDDTRARVLAVLARGLPSVLDADALSVFEGRAGELFEAISDATTGPTVLTPHIGEFRRLFPDIALDDKVAAATEAAKASGAVVVLKGPDTVIASGSGDSGKAIINAHAPATLATAGAGDVLAGIVAGLLAQGMDAFAAGAMATWLLGEAAYGAGERGIIAEDLVEAIPAALTAALEEDPDEGESGLI